MDENLSLYRAFHAVATHKNISKAAAELFVSQPALSKSIQRLEESMDCSLFIRSSRGVQLTEEGSILFEHTSTAFHLLHQGEEQVRIRKEKGAGQLRIGASTTLTKYILIPLLKNFIDAHPHIKVSIHCQSTFETVKLLEEGKIDLALTGKIDSKNPFLFEKCTDIQDVFVATHSYLESLPPQESPQQNILNRSNLMLLDEDNISRLYINQYFQLHQIELNQVLEISTMDLLIEFAKIGLGVACVIKEFVKEELATGTLVEIPLTKPIKKRSVGFAYAKKGINQSSVESFFQIL